jgi:hypothetical protein
VSLFSKYFSQECKSQNSKGLQTLDCFSSSILVLIDIQVATREINGNYHKSLHFFFP